MYVFSKFDKESTKNKIKVSYNFRWNMFNKSKYNKSIYHK